MIYQLSVYQWHLTQELVDLVNEKGWSANEATLAYLDKSFGRDTFDAAANFSNYELVAQIATDDLTEAFSLMNLWNKEDRILRIGEKQSSMSVGDILELNGEFFVVENCGFKKLEMAEAA